MKSVTKILVLALVSFTLGVGSLWAQNKVETVSSGSNDKLYFYNDGELGSGFSLNTSFLKSFKGYENWFVTSEPKLDRVMRSIISYRVLQDKFYIPTWVVKDSTIYFSKIKAYGYLNNDEAAFQSKAYKAVEKLTGRKFDSQFDSPNKEIANSDLMKADWVNGEFYISQNGGANMLEPWRKIVVKSGKISYLEPYEQAQSLQKRRDKKLYDTLGDNI